MGLMTCSRNLQERRTVRREEGGKLTETDSPDSRARVDIQLYSDVSHGWDNFVIVGTDHLTGLLGRYRDPSPRHLNHGLGVHQTVAIAVGDIPVNTIHLPILGLQVDLLSSSDHDVLHISPGQVRVGLQGQSYDGRGHGGAGTGARVLRGALVVQVSRHDLPVAGRPRAVGGGDGGGAGLAVPGNLPPLRGAGHRDRVDGGRVAVTVTVVFIPAPVTAGPDKY